ncbi:GSCOCG00005736001-RA-CDS [Cotesia congregata]|nr:GSCOCG00005736001-RA-CDS [Cotesia congregata]
MRFIILLATLCLAAAYPSDDNSGFVDVDVPMSMEPSDTDEVVDDGNPVEEMPGSVEGGAEEGSNGSEDENSSNDAEYNPKEGDQRNREEPNDFYSEEPTSHLCTKAGNVRNPETCGFVMCSEGPDGSFSELHHQPCPHHTCFDEKNNRCEWKSKLNL